MKKNIIVVLITLFCTTILLTGCGSSKIAFEKDFGQTTVAPLNQNNFHVVKRVRGESSSTVILGFINIGELTNDYLKNSAITKMYDNAQLTGSQTIVDVNVVKSRRFIVGIVYVETIVVATGTVIEFDGPANDVNPKSVRIVQ